MTKQVPVVDVSSFSTDAKFRSWGLAMSTAMQASGLVKTSDTGQIDWTTASKPTAINTQAGYEIYRYSDSLQATYPVFFRVGYGSGGVASGNQPCTWMTVGTGSNGSGTITGLTTGSATQGFNTSTTPSNTNMAGMFTHTSDGYCLMAFGLGLIASAASNAGIWFIDRTRSSSTGAATGQGIILGKLAQSTGSVQMYALDFSTGTAYTTARQPVSPAAAETYSMATGSSIPMAKNYVPLGGLVPIMGVVGYYMPDIAQSSTFTATPFGSSARTYFAMGVWGNYYSPTSTNINPTAAVLWEN